MAGTAPMRRIVAVSTRAEDAALNFTNRAYPYDSCGQPRSGTHRRALVAEELLLGGDGAELDGAVVGGESRRVFAGASK